MHVVSDDGRSWNPVVVMRGSRRRVHKAPDGRSHTVHEYLPCGTKVSLRREVSSMNTDIFFEWAKQLVKDTELLRSQYKHIASAQDGFDAH